MYTRRGIPHELDPVLLERVPQIKLPWIPRILGSAAQEEQLQFSIDVVRVLQQNPGWSIAIEGHTDNIGSDASNLDLSKRRAASVMQYLIDHGIDASRLTSEGYGMTQPIADNKSAKGREQNRRVEMKILEQD